ncbi:hypothetical protein Nepgr_002313 [Nepenthes gracilis]|uniref:RING-type domain-containing protein n=1 Tax=Nepenthes gracilis TaxID=150966 RepID=A0AAD3P9I5_NEPGR|nr:hypothetical protein Nepgr_002313 [Nepenthes gracilis]
MVGGNAFAKTVCSICYEYLKPIEENLQVISLCGHVFHELCLLQWFEYCTNGKNCPVCKQICSSKNVRRLYFQSIGDPILSRSQNVDDDNNRKILRILVTKMEALESNFKLFIDRHKKYDNDRIKELRICKEQLSKEVMLKNKGLKQKESIQQMLQTKTGELVRSTSECSRLQEKNLALAKELAALKLSYKELMAKCNNLRRGEAHSLRKLERAEEKITKIKDVLEGEVSVKKRKLDGKTNALQS